MDVTIYIAVALGLVILYFIFGRGGGEKKGKPLPGPKGLPVVGYAFELGKAPIHEVFFDLAEKFGDVCQINVFGKPFVLLNSTESIKKAFGEDPYRQYMNDRVETFMGKWLFFDSQGPAFHIKAHNSAHRALTKGNIKAIGFFGEGRKDYEEKSLRELTGLAKKLEGLNGEGFDVEETLKRSLTNMFSIVLAGYDVPDDDVNVNMFWDFVGNGMKLVRQDVDVLLRTFPFLRWLPPYKNMCDMVEVNTEKILKKYFHDLKATFEPGTIRGLVDVLFQEQYDAQTEGREVVFTDIRIKAVTLENIGADLNTILSALCIVFLLLIDHPDKQAKIQEELDRVIGRSRPPSLSDMRKCVYTEAFLLEMQRYCPPATVNAIHCCYDNIEFEGWDIPAKSVVAPNIWYAHHNEKIWGDPWEFRPERWLDERGELLPNDHELRKHWLAFGTGGRKCPGEGLGRARMFLYVATQLQHLTWELAPGQVMSSDPRKSEFFTNYLTIRPKQFMARVVPRDN